MTDIARLGFSADTSDLDDAKASLDALVPSAKRVQTAAEGVGSSANKMNTGLRAAAAGATGAKGAFGILAAGANSTSGAFGTATRNTLMAGSAMGTVQAAAAGASAKINVLGHTVTGVGLKFAQADTHVEAYKASLVGLAPAAASAQSSLNRLGAAANDNINRLQSTPGNIAAQFQDIGVTAAGGMSPLLIALQQGTQLSSAMAGGFGNLLKGFAQILSPTTILTIALVGLAAAGLQNVDWMGLAQSVLNGLADAMETVSVAAAYLGVVLLIAFAPQILAMIVRMTVAIAVGLWSAIVKVTLAMIAFSLANPFTALVLAIGAVIGAMILLNDTFGGVFTSILEWVKNAVNFIIGGFVGAFNTIKRTWSMLPAAIGDVAIQAANATLNAVENMVNGVVNRINGIASQLPFGLDFTLGGVDFGEIDNQFEGALQNVGNIAAEEIGRAQGVDYVGGFIEGVQGLGDWAAGILRGWAGSIGAGEAEDGSGSDSAARTLRARAQQDPYGDIVKGVQAEIAALAVESQALTMSANAARQFRNEQDILAKALEKGINLTAAQRNELMGLATTLTNGQIAVEFQRIIKSADDMARSLDDQSELIGIYGIDLEYARIRQGLLNQAIAAGVIDLDNMTDAMQRQLDIINERADALAIQTVDNQQLEFMEDLRQAHDIEMFQFQQEAAGLYLVGEALDAHRRATDVLVAAKQAKIDLAPDEIAWIQQIAAEEAAAAEQIRRIQENIKFTRDVTKQFFSEFFDGIRKGESMFKSFGEAILGVLDRILDKLLNDFLDQMMNNITGPAGGGGGGIFGFITRLVSGGLGASGGGFGYSTAPIGGGAGFIPGFAKGGSFSNSIVDRPTLFQFAKGAGLGQMGEAGPEAIMPLKRGSDGSLGVQVQGDDRSRSAPANVSINVQSDYHLSGAISAGDIAQAIQQSGKQTEQTVKRNLQTYLQQIQTDGSVV